MTINYQSGDEYARDATLLERTMPLAAQHHTFMCNVLDAEHFWRARRPCPTTENAHLPAMSQGG